MATALVSAIIGTPGAPRRGHDRRDHAERRVLPIGGVKEKVLGAHRAGIRHIVLPKQNEADLDDVPAEVQRELEFHLGDVERRARGGAGPPGRRRGTR